MQPKKKKMRSTHACTPSFRNFLTIFTSVVVYSRTTKRPKKQKKKQKWHRVAFNFFVFLWSQLIHLNTCTVVQITKKKCGAHTHVHHLSRISSSQYSRRLLSILARTNKKKKQKKSKRIIVLGLIFCLHHHITFLIKSYRKKNGAHMHAHHLSQLSYRIFTSVVVYSRTTKSFVTNLKQQLFA